MSATVEAAFIGLRLDGVVLAMCEALEEEDSERLFGAEEPSRSQITRWIKAGLVAVDGKVITKAGFVPNSGSSVRVTVPVPAPSALDPDPSVSFEIVFEDDAILVINKPAGLVVHPAAGNRGGTLVNGLLAYLGAALQPIGGELRPGLVHRLDKGTTGLMVVAKTEHAYVQLVRQFAPPRTVHRSYLALVAKLPKGGVVSEGMIDLPIGRNPRDRLKMAVDQERGRPSVTHWRVEQRLQGGYLLDLQLETGRTHQIRVHLGAVGAPILGDPLYGPQPHMLEEKIRVAAQVLGRQALHASKLSFVHPVSSHPVEYRADLPDDLRGLLNVMTGDL
ncbi:MAG: RluA family pseudouridine synthase [Deltaproteobacteria bacterium]|nr:RluA family pseudouridine synthase [Deltaproteobacteria bacterium]